ncbi:MAG TPA: M42 family metallopeptidase [Firmicutes bacterium]|nr:M42 family metallopeptidase [Bacillota bacterium]
MLLTELSAAFGVSGREGEVRDLIRREIAGHVDRVEIDILGNLLLYKEGAEGKPVVMLSAHMDEAGLMVADIEENGFIKFHKVGAIDDRVLASKVVEIGQHKVKGVIGAKAIHQQKVEERKKTLLIDQLYIDIGAGSREEAKKKVKIGDYIAFVSEASPFGAGNFKGKAMDNRAGCYVLAELLKEKQPLSFWGAFTVQEEIGLRGAGIAAYKINPDLAIVIETTIAADYLDNESRHQVTELGKGPAVTFMDASFISHRKFYEFVLAVAEKNRIPYQLRRFSGSGTDAGRISLARAGVPACVLSIPCRYMHAPVSVINLADVENTTRLLKAILHSLAEGEFKLCWN